MKKNQYLILSMMLMVFMITSCRETIPIKSIQGVLDLRSHNFNDGKPVAMTGEWAFYWKKVVQPDAGITYRVQTEYLEVPGFWTKLKSYNEKFLEHGYGSYKIELLLDSSHVDKITFRIPSISNPMIIYFNDNLICKSGIFGFDQYSSKQGGGGQIITVPVEKDENLLTVIVANYHSRTPGLTRPLLCGSEDSISGYTARTVIFDSILFGMLIVFSMLFLLNFLLFRKMRSLLYFSIICFLYSFRPLVSGNLLPIMHTLIENYEVLAKIDYLSFYAPLIFFPLYYAGVFRGLLSRYFKYSLIVIAVLFVVFVISLPLSIYQYSFSYFRIFGIINILLFGWLLIKKVKEGSSTARFLLSGIVIFSLSVFHDNLVGIGVLKSMSLLPFGVLGLIISQLFALSFYMFRLYRQHEVVSLELGRKIMEVEKTNFLLEKTIDEKTNAFNLRNKELEAAIEMLNQTRSHLIKDNELNLSHISKGIAHELKNPLNFITNFSIIGIEITTEIIDLMKSDPDSIKCYKRSNDSLNKLQIAFQSIKEYSSITDTILNTMFNEEDDK